MKTPHYQSLAQVGENIWEDRAGFWFRDETEDLNGPYETYAEADEALSDYIKNELEKES